MKSCALLERYRDKELAQDQRIEFERHLEHCQGCSLQVDLWQNMERAIVDLSDAVAGAQSDWSDDVRRALIARVDGRRGKGRAPRPALQWAFACGLILAVGAVLFLFFGPGREPDLGQPVSDETKTVLAELISPGGVKALSPISAQGGTLRAGDQGRVLARIEGDRFGAKPGAVVQVVEVSDHTARFRLKKGTCAWSVAHRKGQGKFVVHAGAYTVRVIGTRFLTALSDDDALSVHVTEGAVAVEIPGQKTRAVRRGRHLVVSTSGVEEKELTSGARQEIAYLLSEDPKALPPQPADRTDDLQPGDADRSDREDRDRQSGDRTDRTALRPVQKTEPAPTIGQMEEWVIQGRLEKADSALKEYLKTAPTDTEAWSLLADCRRKTGDWSGAVSALKKVIVHSPPGASNPARFKAGAILQDRLGLHTEAIELFEAYLGSTGARRPLEVEALMRLARSQRAIGRVQAARKTLETVIEKHDGTVSAAKARELLEELGGHRK